jgi:hypothetical protein
LSFSLSLGDFRATEAYLFFLDFILVLRHHACIPASKTRGVLLKATCIPPNHFLASVLGRTEPSPRLEE